MIKVVTCPFSKYEMDTTLFSIYKFKALDLDGFPIKFFQFFWKSFEKIS